MLDPLSDVQLNPPVGERDHVHGRADAPMTLVEYGDYECPDCGRAYAVIKDLQDRLGERLRFVFRNFPLVGVHAHAEQAAAAAEEAAAQGRFWEMHDCLFEHQGELDDSRLRGYAAVIVGLDMDAYDLAMAQHRHAGRVREDVLSGEASGVTAPPAFFINGVRHNGRCDVDTLLDALLRAELAVALTGPLAPG
jgi:protein-disulfide isomerase